MKIVLTSDIHNNFRLLESLKSREADMLIVAGDLTNRGSIGEITTMLMEIDLMKGFRYKVVVFGNHDIKAEAGIQAFKDHYKDIIFLNNEITEIEGLKIYGSPYVREFCDWGFQYYNMDERRKLTIPSEPVDIIITHEPPSDRELSYIYNFDGTSEDIGNPDLRRYIEETPKVRLVVCGHVHENSGNAVSINNAVAYNVSGMITTALIGGNSEN